MKIILNKPMDKEDFKKVIEKRIRSALNQSYPASKTIPYDPLNEVPYVLHNKHTIKLTKDPDRVKLRKAERESWDRAKAVIFNMADNLEIENCGISRIVSTNNKD